MAGSAAVCDYLTQRARPQLFSNALPPTVAASALASVEYLEAHPERVATLRANASYFRERLLELGFKPLPGETPIIPVILGETSAAIRMSELLLAEGVFVTGFGFPVVPQGQARVRCQVSAAHTRADLDQALAAFRKVGGQLGLIGMTVPERSGVYSGHAPFASLRVTRTVIVGPDLALPRPPMGGDGPLAAYINCHAASS